MFLLVLSVLTAIVWWRVLHRPTASSTTTTTPSVTAAPLTCTPGGKAIRLPAPQTVLVVVLNGANRNQLATQVTAQLKARGFRTGKPDDAPSPMSGTAEIQFSTASRAAATLLSYYVPGARLVASSPAGSPLTLVLGTGFHALAPQAAVKQSVASAGKPC
ncbi:MAG TPA: LytR C-terminal domain-containing protein [Jatrophihabitans sp.]|nr:LytR C-terminal domain-containing protein [Jatrophihabitans sp.]